MTAIPINFACEDILSEAVLTTLVEKSETNFEKGTTYMRRGSGYLKKNIRGFNNAAKGGIYLVQTDLDRYRCPPELLTAGLKNTKNPNLLFSVGVRAWLMADRDGFATFIGVHGGLVPRAVEDVTDPKSLVIRLARRSRKRTIRDDLLPKKGSTAKQGRNYNAALTGFVLSSWDPGKAAKNAPSLDRLIQRLNHFEVSTG